MKNILDRLEAIARRWFYLISVSIVAATMAALFVCTYRMQRTVYEIPEGACYCPSCGMVMVIGEGAAER